MSFSRSIPSIRTIQTSIHNNTNIEGLLINWFNTIHTAYFKALAAIDTDDMKEFANTMRDKYIPEFLQTMSCATNFPNEVTFKSYEDSLNKYLQKKQFIVAPLLLHLYDTQCHVYFKTFHFLSPNEYIDAYKKRNQCVTEWVKRKWMTTDLALDCFNQYFDNLHGMMSRGISAIQFDALALNTRNHIINLKNHYVQNAGTKAATSNSSPNTAVVSSRPLTATTATLYQPINTNITTVSASTKILDPADKPRDDALRGYKFK
ncbi:hypothetical protein AYO45_00235 [Gammaproteobacteria bacterium SCGC AG-212-F23]|nr:hypothetical protein AYO45_00235 [Gammaproteobacteria bacterium SCGC AG-212-F23]